MKITGVRLMLIFTAIVMVGMSGIATMFHTSWSRNYDEMNAINEATYAAVQDPKFVEQARHAGYRIGVLSAYENSRDYAVIEARCARSDSTGPLPCDSFPYDRVDPKVVIRMKL